MFLYRLADQFEKKKVRYALVGGYAVALHGAVRGTIDVDIVVSLTRKGLQQTEAALAGIGLVSRLPVNAEEVFSFREDYVRKRNLIAWSFHHPARPIEVVDVLITEDLADFETVKLKIDGHNVHLASVNDLIRMKTKAARPQDLADVAALKELRRK